MTAKAKQKCKHKDGWEGTMKGWQHLPGIYVSKTMYNVCFVCWDTFYSRYGRMNQLDGE